MHWLTLLFDAPRVLVDAGACPRIYVLRRSSSLSAPLARVIHEYDERSADFRTFHTELAECFIFGVTEPLDHRAHGEHPGISPWSLCLVSATSVRNSFPSSSTPGIS
jgi:hypothetical protein